MIARDFVDPGAKVYPAAGKVRTGEATVAALRVEGDCVTATILDGGQAGTRH